MGMGKIKSKKDYYKFFIYKRYNYYLDNYIFKMKGNLLLAVIFVIISILGYLIYVLLS